MSNDIGTHTYALVGMCLSLFFFFVKDLIMYTILVIPPPPTNNVSSKSFHVDTLKTNKQADLPLGLSHPLYGCCIICSLEDL